MFFISGCAHYKIIILSFYTTLSEAVSSIIMTVILSKHPAASATEMTPQLLLTKWNPLLKKKIYFYCKWPLYLPF